MISYSSNEILILNLNFFVDKIYKSIVFDFGDALILSKATHNGKIIKSMVDFIGIFGDDFVEEGLFYEVMTQIFRQKDYKHFNGDRLKALIGTGGPDLFDN